jgi:hypothetical protein
VRARLYLGRMLPDGDEDDEKHEDDGVRYLCRRKANYSIRDTRKLQFKDGILLPDALPEMPDLLTAGAAQDVVANAVRELAAMGEYGVASTSSPSYLPKLAAAYKLLDRLTKKDFGTAMRTMQRNGELRVAVVGKYSNRTDRRGLVLAAADACTSEPHK